MVATGFLIFLVAAIRFVHPQIDFGLQNSKKSAKNLTNEEAQLIDLLTNSSNLIAIPICEDSDGNSTNERNNVTTLITAEPINKDAFENSTENDPV